MKLRVGYSSHWLLMLVAVLLCNFALAQRTITGKVTDEATGEPLIGANVLVVGTSNGTVTDIDGSYSLQVPNDTKELEFSYTGYTSKKVALGASNVLDVALSPGQVLEEVVVTGYGTRKAREVTSSITSVKAEDFNSGNVNSPSQLLQGKVPGLTIAKTGGNPNAGFDLRLRGLSTIGANTSPLVVVDGVIGASLDNIDPQDIASVDVLKDGSAAAIYGTRASSGVIIITTKRGAEGSTRVDYTGQVTSESKMRTLDVLNAEEWKKLPGAENNGSSTDWVEEVTQNALSQVHNLSLSGGNNKTAYRFSFNYRDIDGVQKNTGFQRLNGRLNISQKALNDKMTFTANLAGTTRNSDFSFVEVLRYAFLYNPTAPVTKTGAEFTRWGGYFEQDLFDYFNPVSIMNQTSNTGEGQNFLGSLQLDWDLFEGFKLMGLYSQQRDNSFSQQYYNKTARFRGANRNGFASQRTDRNVSEQLDLTGTYTRDFGGLNFKLLGGYSFQEFTFSGFGLDGGNFLTDAFGSNNFGASLDFPKGLAGRFSYKNDYRLIAFLGRLNLNYNNTYFFEASLRREGSSRFGENNKWGMFPAVSFGADLTKALGIGGVINNLKFRAGYGVTGNIPGSSYISLLRFGAGASFFYNGAYVPSYGPVSNANPDLKWETKGELNVGFDFALMNYKLTGTLEYYNRTTQDVFYDATVPVPPNLFSNTLLNVGELNNQGVELALNLAAITKPNFSWETGITGTYYFGTKLVSLSNDAFSFGKERFISSVGAPGLNNNPIIRLREGDKIGEFWGPVYDGLTSEGKWKFKDLNGDGKFCDCDDDFQVIGNGQVQMELGFNNTFRFGKNWDLNLFFRGAFGHDIMNSYRIWYETVNTGTKTWNKIKTDYWTDGKLTEAPKFSSFHIEKGDFFKLDNATLGYTLNLPAGSAFSKVRFYLNGQNLFVLTKYQGVDPEVRFFDAGEGDNGGDPGNGAGVFGPGIDRRNNYYMVRGFTFGAQIGF